MPNGIAYNGGDLFIASLEPYKTCKVRNRAAEQRAHWLSTTCLGVQSGFGASKAHFTWWRSVPGSRMRLPLTSPQIHYDRPHVLAADLASAQCG